MTQLALAAPGTYSGQHKVGRWRTVLAAHVSEVFAFLACYPPYTLDPGSPADSEWKLYEPASKWLDKRGS